MESTLCLKYGPLPSLAQRIPFTVSTTRATKPHFCFGHSSLSLSYASRTHLIGHGHAFSPITKKKTLSLRVSAFPRGGKDALKSLLDVGVYLASVELNSLGFPKTPSLEQANTLYKNEAMRLLKSGKGNEAEELLRKAIEECGYSESDYYLAIILAEILIFKGSYQQAHKCLEDHQHPSDARYALYKAIVCTMLDKMDDAEKWWESFTEGRSDSVIPNHPEH
ncbi:hypothetical protein RGQ29_019995 [Quercus rubra]|uniref:Uncharacterized protein n=1 Tax=Quercus rubra TaxID=3512 RepID=A0AAN7FCJ7_QUERU|nr:hypothetical protein RGQ29_019995 [Quercus rubra]